MVGETQRLLYRTVKFGGNCAGDLQKDGDNRGPGLST